MSDAHIGGVIALIAFLVGYFVIMGAWEILARKTVLGTDPQIEDLISSPAEAPRDGRSRRRFDARWTARRPAQVRPEKKEKKEIMTGDDDDTIAALAGLGIAPALARAAARHARATCAEGAPLEELLREALRACPAPARVITPEKKP